ncbi:TPA: conjugal transfer protein TraM [Aeromonas hydrophila]|uniref:conjugal transfer protein TraM n=1 Tax=Aeromonas TaxID=642 RepID=UPI001CCD55CF|nr:MULTISPECIES: conjugal transfer protein TraM [Aeromonas]MDX7846606.1 conjugal transfer protein TraM [Aeromonas caviae]UBQ52795.1 conjugal transfer protein TraM [Aeromonas hydrophila]HDI1215595.1 conjugal transfer protein TraM [Aeromonas hydrophila]
MTDPFEEIIQEIALKHGVAIGRDDPILILQTLNNKLMKDSVLAQQQQLDLFKEELEAIAYRWGEDAKTKAERTLNAAMAASREEMYKGMKLGAQEAAVIMKKEVAEGLKLLSQPINEAKRVAHMNLVAAGMVVFAAGLALLAAII